MKHLPLIFARPFTLYLTQHLESSVVSRETDEEFVALQLPLSAAGFSRPSTAGQH